MLKSAFYPLFKIIIFGIPVIQTQEKNSMNFITSQDNIFKISVSFLFTIISVNLYSMLLYFILNNIFHSKEQIIQDCFNKNSENLVIMSMLNNTSPGNIFLDFPYVNSPVSIFRVDTNTFFKNYEYNAKMLKLDALNDIRKTYQVTSVIIIVSSIEIFMTVMEGMSGSIWWNHEAYFLVVNNDAISGCNMSNEFLKVIWKFNILFVTYLCKNLNNQLLLYTFNPYADLAPNLWKKVPQGKETWTLFQHLIYSESKFSKYF